MESKDFAGPAESVQDKATIRAAFGEAQQIGEQIVIPVAQVTYGYGYGSGSGSKPTTDENVQPEGFGGGGGGAGARVKPLGALVVTPTNVRFEAALEILPMAIGGMLLAAWNVYWITKTVRQGLSRRRSAEE